MVNAWRYRTYQIDYILMNSRYWNSVTNAKTYPGADIGSDHNLVAARLRVKLKKILKARLISNGIWIR